MRAESLDSAIVNEPRKIVRDESCKLLGARAVEVIGIEPHLVSIKLRISLGVVE